MNSRHWESNPEPQLYESCALPLSYVGKKVSKIRPTGRIQGQADLSVKMPTSLRFLREGRPVVNTRHASLSLRHSPAVRSTAPQPGTRGRLLLPRHPNQPARNQDDSVLPPAGFPKSIPQPKRAPAQTTRNLPVVYRRRSPGVP